MNRDEIRKEAEEHSKNYPFTIYLHKRVRKSGKQIAIENYIAGAESREKTIKRAKELINDFLLILRMEHLAGRYETLKEAEEFLKGEK